MIISSETIALVGIFGTFALNGLVLSRLGIAKEWFILTYPITALTFFEVVRRYKRREKQNGT